MVCKASCKFPNEGKCVLMTMVLLPFTAHQGSAGSLKVLQRFGPHSHLDCSLPLWPKWPFMSAR